MFLTRKTHVMLMEQAEYFVRAMQFMLEEFSDGISAISRTCVIVNAALNVVY